jgi:hypothetical protein
VKCDRQAFARSWFIARIIGAAISQRSALIDGRMTFGYLIWSRISFVGRAEQRAPISDRTSTGTRSQRPGALVTNRGWKRPFDDPIPLPRGRQLVTLEDAGTYITRMPKAEHEAAEWQAAMEALILVATLGGPTMFARIGVMRALNRGLVREFDSTRKDTHWGRRKKRDEWAGENNPVRHRPSARRSRGCP